MRLGEIHGFLSRDGKKYLRIKENGEKLGILWFLDGLGGKSGSASTVAQTLVQLLG